MGPWVDWLREGGGARIWHLGPVGPIRTIQICASNFTDADPSSPIGFTSAKGTNIAIIQVAPQPFPNRGWIWHRPADLPSPALVRIGLPLCFPKLVWLILQWLPWESQLSFLLLF